VGYRYPERMQTEIRLLGPVEARVDGYRIDLGHPRRQCVLVALAVDAGRPVPPDRLLARVWGGATGSRNSLYGYLSRLRQSFAATGVELSREAAGYRLGVDPAAVDLHRFAQLTTRARRQPSQAEDLLTEGLALWRGDAFGTLNSPWLAGLRDSVHRDRLAAELDRAELVLARGGRPAGLAGLAAEHPLDERVAGLLLRTLYLSGRQAEALEAYERLRRRLAEELGADPTPALRRLHREMLSGAAAPPPAPAQMPAPVPRQLPAPPRPFGGRSRELAALGAAPAGAPVVIGGPGGMGKTWLALRWAYDNLDRFPDGQLYVNLRGFEPDGDPVSPVDALGTLLASLGVPTAAQPADLDARAALLRSAVAGRRLLILLDNARDTAQLVPLLPGTGTGAVLVTSRSELTGLVRGHGARPVTLDVLSDAESREVLVGHLGPDRTQLDPPAVDALVAGCAGLPLALGVTAARAAVRPELPLAALATELCDSARRLDALDGGEPAVGLRAALTCSLRALPAGAGRVFRLLGLAPGPDIGLAAAAGLAGLPVADTRARLAELTAVRLVSEHRPGRYRMHDLVRLYAAEQGAGTDPDAVPRLLDHLLRTGSAAGRLLYPQRDPVPPPPALPGVVPEPLADYAAADAWFAAESQVLLAAVELAAATGADVHAWQLAWTLTAYFDRNDRMDDQLAAQTTALAATRRLGDRAAEALAHRRLATALTRLGRYEQADRRLGDALELFERLGDRTGQAHTALNRAFLLARRGRVGAAIGHTHRAAALYAATGKRTGQADALNALGWLHAERGEHRPAIAHCRRALALHRELGYRHGEANTWDSLGVAHHHLGELDRATECFDRALALYLSLGERTHVAETSGRLGDTLSAAGLSAEAAAAWRTSADTYAEIGRPRESAARARLATAVLPE
jgi:DNA-binding SARP family transcriptional activator/tetratricopeptide (TPR) repeat protein